jgi:hypothetical protein
MVTNRVTRPPTGAASHKAKVPWICEQAHQQLKEDLGLDQRLDDL